MNMNEYWMWSMRRARRRRDPYERGFWHGVMCGFIAIAFVMLWVSAGGAQ